MKRLSTVLAAMAVMTGCASAPVIAPEVSDELSTSGIAAAFYMEGKKIKYNEMVYKVLWNETRAQESVFEGSWDIDRDLTGTFSGSLESIGLSSRPIHSLLSDELYGEFEQSILNTRGADGVNVPMSMNGRLRDALLQQGVDYVVLLRAANYAVEKISGFSPKCTIPSLLIVFDVRRNRQAHDAWFQVGGALAVEESAREIEADGLAKLKTATADWLSSATASRMPETLGLAAAN